MKLTLSLLAVLAACSVSAIPVSDDAPNVPYNRYIDFLDEAGVKQTIDLEEEPDVAFLESLARDENDINGYFLFTRKNPESSQELVQGDAESIANSNFNPEVSTVVIAHGWLSNQESGVNTVIRDAFLGQDDFNVIVLDWRPLAIRNYVTAARGVPAVGRNLGRFLAFLADVTGISLSTSVHLVGFSLGAHLVGNAGRALEGQVARVTALDPAGPLFNLNSNRIGSNDGIYVEGMHTDGGLTDVSLGLGLSIGDVDFFPNGGSSQPGCFTTSICSHNRAWRLFAATVTYNHLEGRRCSNILQITLGTCRGERLKMGNSDLNKTGSGRFRVSTSRRYPY